MRVATQLLLLAGCLPVLCGCTLAGLGDFDLEACESHAQCDMINAIEGIDDDACEGYQCREIGQPGCELRPRDLDGDGFITDRCEGVVEGSLDCDDTTNAIHPDAQESCNGIDDNCDVVIDDGAWLAFAPRAVGDITVDASAQYVQNDLHDQTLLTFSDGSAARSLHIVGGDVQSDDAMSYGIARPPAATEGDLTGKCDRATGPGSCDFTELAASRSEGGHFALAINTKGCSSGQLRAGVATDGGAVVFGSPDVSTALEYGIDLDGQCSGASRPDAVLGASRPSISIAQAGGLPGDTRVPQALGTWLADTAERPRCEPGSSVAVEAMGFWIRGGSGDGWIDGSNAGLPQSLGESSGGAPPAMLAWDTSTVHGGYFVGFGGAADTLQLRFIPYLRDPKDGDTAPLPLQFSAEAGIDVSAPVDHVVMAATPQLRDPRDGTDLGVAWRQGCGDDARVGFLQVRFGGAEALSFDASDAIGFGGDGGVLEGPVLAYAEAAILSDRSSQDDGPIGGWAVLWVRQGSDGQELVGVRVLRDARQVDREPLVLASGSVVRLPSVHTRSPASSGAAVAAHYLAGNQLMEAGVICVGGQ